MAAALARPLVARKLAEVAAIERADEIIDRASTAENLWGREGERYLVTRSPAEAPDTAAELEITFEDGAPTAVNGVPMGMTELIESLARFLRKSDSLFPILSRSLGRWAAGFPFFFGNYPVGISIHR